MSVVVFLLGLYVAVYVVGTAYRVIDLFYCLGERYTDVLGRWLVAGLVVAGLVWLLPASLEPPFFAGFMTYLVIHFVFFYALKALLVAVTRRR